MAAPMAEERSSSNKNNLDENEYVQPKVQRCNWLLEHPKYVEMKSWDLDNEEQIFITLIVYINLCEAKDWWNVTIHPCRELQLAFITGKPNRKDDVRVVLPITSNNNLTHERLQQFLQYIHLPAETPSTIMNSSEEPVDGETSHSVTLAITESGSTIVYYKISNGLVPPSDPPKEDEEEEIVSQRKRHKKPPKRAVPRLQGCEKLSLNM